MEDPDKGKDITPKLKDLLISQKEQAYLSRFLGLICQEAPIDFNLDQCQWQGCAKEAVKALEVLGFKTLIERLPGLDKNCQKEKVISDKKNLRLW